MRHYNLNEHPCYTENARHRFARIHLPVAPRCNIRCKYCKRDYHCVNESRPGVTCKVLSPVEAFNITEELIGKDPRISVIGIAGPGDPLANIETFETLHLIHKKYPYLLKCLSTNGLMLSGKVEELYSLGVRAITVTINCIRPSTASKIYSYVDYHGVRYPAAEGAAVLLSKQLEGVREAAGRGISVKVNTIHIPGVNDDELLDVAKTVKKMGADIMNIMPLIPLADFADSRTTSKEELAKFQKDCGEVITIFKHCQRCRADAAGLITERTTVLTSALSLSGSRLGEIKILKHLKGGEQWKKLQ